MAVDTETLCPVMELPTFCCSHCRSLPWEPATKPDEDEQDDRSSSPLGPVVEAFNGGKCSGCEDRRFGPGELIRADGFGGWLVVDCCGGGDP